MRTSRTDLSRRQAPAGVDPGRIRLRRAGRIAAGAWALALLVVPTAAPRALDASIRTPVQVPAQVPVADKGYRSAKDALRAGVREYNAGDKQGAARALEYAAGQGHALALWKLGRMYAEGDGVPHDDLKAFEFFSRIADASTDDGPDPQNSAVLGSAFTALGTYFLEGIKGSYVRPNPERAYDMFNYAASYYGDPNAQYNLARLYLDGTGVESDPRQAARWFNLAAEKGHHPAQALLGDMLVNGLGGIPIQRVKGLMWLSLAREGAESRKDDWIVGLYDKNWAAANDDDRAEAQTQLQTVGSIKRRR
ncbi:tetratricopeptide repeat protein [Methylobacterium sp. E-046]|uniref:tetratricopeptide repeat protein n=1 Tax=Methylobacterium sp. E-046 TaxID=2836576 RepID=UPI001FBB5D78|nr:tetratricopeptide repeat protein [Methylobacterium sp. E-046]MCJ2097777.1 sel1 repeat family protein [Methylobacterium sp. E-046]